MQVIILPAGELRCVYDELIDLRTFGEPQIKRASHVEPITDGRWQADLSPIGGPMLGPFDLRTDALQAERCWLEIHWLAAVR